jgi:methylphosphotriester-DNA--protein-cysteine methyltransferase
VRPPPAGSGDRLSQLIDFAVAEAREKRAGSDCIAARLLAEGGAKVSAVALRVGYDSEAAFSRAFKSITGVPPAAWRRRGPAWSAEAISPVGAGRA